MANEIKFWRDDVDFFKTAFPASKIWQLTKLAFWIIVLIVIRQVIVMYGVTL